MIASENMWGRMVSCGRLAIGLAGFAPRFKAITNRLAPAKPLEIKPVDPTFASFGRIAFSRAIQLRSRGKRIK
jgi:hypothetical protein